jgi:hypothetical protein
MILMGKRLFQVDLLDTITGRLIKSGEVSGRYPRDAMRRFAKDLSKTINLKEMRDKQFARYVFLASKRRS